MFAHHYTLGLLGKFAQRLLRAPDDLESLLQRMALPVAALHAPVAIERRGVRVVIDPATKDPPRVVVPTPSAINVVGFYCVAKPLLFGASFKVDLDDFEAQLDVETESLRLFTAQTTSNPSGFDKALGGYAPLGSLHCSGGSPTLFMLRLTGAQPKLGITIRSRYTDDNGSGLPGAVVVSVHAVTSPLVGPAGAGGGYA